MFSVYERVQDFKVVKKPVRANMAIKLKPYGAIDFMNAYEVVSSSKGTLVLRDPSYALDIIASDDLSAFYKLLSNDNMSIEEVIIVSNGKEYPVKQEDDKLYYEVRQETWNSVMQVPSVGFEDVAYDSNGDGYELKVIAVNKTQLVTQLENGEYVIFEGSDLAVYDSKQIELSEISWEKYLK